MCGGRGGGDGVYVSVCVGGVTLSTPRADGKVSNARRAVAHIASEGLGAENTKAGHSQDHDTPRPDNTGQRNTPTHTTEAECVHKRQTYITA